jgi:hypothetical protein
MHSCTRRVSDQQIRFAVFLGKFFRQDIYLDYHWGNSYVRLGQFTPKFCIQRFQPDYLIPRVERARPVMYLVPDGTLGVRDIGVQYNLNAAEKKLEFNAGVFNGYGIKDYRFNNNGIMLTHNLSYTFNIDKSILKIGYSVMFRKAEDLQLLRILPDTVLYTGNEFHWNIYGMFSCKILDFQAEYLHAGLNDGIANGFYGLATFKIGLKHQVFVSYDKYESIYSSELNNPLYNIVYNNLIDKYNIKLTLDTGFKEYYGKLSNITVLQFQFFIH